MRLLELDATAGELALDPADVALALVELLPLRLRESLLRLGSRDCASEVALGRLGAGGTSGPPAVARSFLDLAHEPLLEFGDVTCPLGERPLHLRHFRESVLVTRPHVRQFGHPPSVACAAAPGNRNRLNCFLGMDSPRWVGSSCCASTTSRELLRRLNEIPGVAITDVAITRRPRIPLDMLGRDPAALEAFLLVFDWFWETVRMRPNISG